MLPSDIETSAREQYNAVGDSFFPTANIYNWIWHGELILATKTNCIQALDTSQSTVASTQNYAYGTNVYKIKRLVVNGRKLKPISFRQDDAVTLQNSVSQQAGQPAYYTIWNKTIYMRPIPDAVYSMSIYSFNLPVAVTGASQTLEIPIEYHFDLVDYVLFRMFSQDKNAEMATLHKNSWNDSVREAMSNERRKLRADSFADTQSEDVLPTTIIGAI